MADKYDHYIRISKLEFMTYFHRIPDITYAHQIRRLARLINDGDAFTFGGSSSFNLCAMEYTGPIGQPLYLIIFGKVKVPLPTEHSVRVTLGNDED
jgi:hypothetical protein